jgi:hypothetical protein
MCDDYLPNENATNNAFVSLKFQKINATMKSIMKFGGKVNAYGNRCKFTIFRSKIV